MAGKEGTLLGRALRKFIPDGIFHSVADEVDKTIEHIVFDAHQEKELPLKEHHSVTSFVGAGKNMLLHLAEQGLITINFPMVDGDNEKAVEDGLMKVLTAYVDEILD